MTFEGEQRIIPIHPVAVVADADELSSARFDFDPDAVGAGIERIFQQFLGNRSRTVNHFTGSDLICHLVRKNADATHGEKGNSGLQSVDS